VASRPFDVVLYGAAGFTGRQAVKYFAQHGDPGLRWALAGPARDKLENARAAAGGEAAGHDILVADSRDQADDWRGPSLWPACESADDGRLDGCPRSGAVGRWRTDARG
jgi:hypothetical protein